MLLDGAGSGDWSAVVFSFASDFLSPTSYLLPGI